MILITGASGSLGREVLLAAMKRSLPVKAMYRALEDSRNAPSGIAEVIADFADLGSLRKAMQGVETVFLVCSPIPQLVELEGNAIEAAKSAGVRHIVLNSALGAADYSKSFPAWHRQVEEKLKASGLSYVILRPNTFMQNIVAYNAISIRAQGAFYSAMGDARLSFIDVRDIAEATAKILANPPAHSGKVYELNGPEALNYAEVAALISKATERPVRFVNIPEEAQRKAMLDLKMPEWQVGAILDLQRYYSVERKGAEITPVLEQILGHPAIRLEQFLRENKEAFREPAAEPVNPKTSMTHSEMRQFVRNHFEEFVNRKNLEIGNVNFAPEFVDHGTDVPPGTPPGPAGAIAYVGGAYKKFPDIHVDILDLVAEDDRVVVRNRWTGTEAASGKKFEFSGIVIWRIAHRQLVERWAYLTAPKPISG